MTSHAERMYQACAALFAAFVANGAQHVVISPGSRSTPLAIAGRRSGLRCWVQLDERSAAHFGLGLARITGRATVLVCTSGTAAANYLPAVIEANHSGVPLIACTADRPPELRGWGAGQTVDQVGLYGTNTRWFHETPVVSESTPAHLAQIAARAWAASHGPTPGPVHVNIPLREPLEPPPAGGGSSTPEAADDITVPDAGHRGQPVAVENVQRLRQLATQHERGLVVVGPADLDEATAVALAGFADAWGWPIIADPASGLRSGSAVGRGGIISTGDLLFNAPGWMETHGPSAIVRVGSSPTSKPYRLWLEQHRDVTVALVEPGVEWSDPTDSVSLVLHGSTRALFEQATLAAAPERPRAWRERWIAAETVATSSVAHDGPMSEVDVASTLGSELPSGATLVVANSMPIRALDLGLRPRQAPLRVLANRGASGIDGVTATACGAVAAGASPVVLFTGDLSLLYDLSALVAARRLGLRLVVVVVDNGGGGIFSFLPIAEHGDDVHFQELFHAPPEVDLRDVATLGALHYTTATTVSDLRGSLTEALAADRSWLISVPISATDNRTAIAAMRTRTAEVLASS